ncbi:MAG TPA: SAF domain-containing protein [Microlunatus sp.]|nr:SAF domain-containing protein [Microlunatus sp.]
MSIDSPPRPSRRLSLPRRPAKQQTPVVDDPPTTPEPPRLPVRRNPKWIALGIIAICVGGLLSYVIYARVATESAVVAMAATVYRGEVIEASDLTAVTLSGSPSVPSIPADQATTLVGQRAAYDLVDGSIVAPTAVTQTAVPAEKRAVVGMKLAGGRAPADFLVPGSPVRLVALPAPDAQPGVADPYAGKTFVARTVASAPGPDAGSLFVDVDVSADQAPTIAMLAAQERLTVVRDAGR